MSLKKLREVTESLQALPPVGDSDFGTQYQKVCQYAGKQVARQAFDKIMKMIDSAESHAFPKASKEHSGYRRSDMALYCVAELKRMAEDRS